MYRNAYQRGMLTIFFSVGSNPLRIWETYTKDGYITRFLDQDIKSMVLEIGGTNVSTTYIICPKGKDVLGISMPFLVMIIKNLKKYFSFEVTILDETGTRRRFRVSNFQSSTQILPLCTVMPIGLSDGWNQIQFNLAEFTRRAYQKQFVEVQKVKINANIRLRRVYFADRLIPENELPPEYKLYFPVAAKSPKSKKPIVLAEKDDDKPTSSQQADAQLTLDNIRETSKASIHSVKKTSSKESKISKRSKEEGEIILEEKISKLPSKETENEIEHEEEDMKSLDEVKSQHISKESSEAPKEDETDNTDTTAENNIEVSPIEKDKEELEIPENATAEIAD